ncbi:MAG: fimbria/pilus periplasmic chaperone [Woeseiaceae bacterium]|nr:fimbria/pilus periplasmic chaperone [Woeseiaceae bacterium]
MTTTERNARKAAFFAAFLLLLGTSAAALASVNVSPVLLEMSESKDKDVVRVTNSSGVAKSFEVNAVTWTQSDQEREIYSATDDVLAVPPLFTLQPGQTQVVRIGLMRPVDETTELAYRVFFTELAPPETSDENNGVNMRLRFGIPVFVAPLAPAHSAVQLVQLATLGNQTAVQLRNSGNVRVKVMEIRYLPSPESAPEVTPAVFYLHPGMTGYLPVDIPGANATGTLELVTDTAGVLKYVLAELE